MKYNNRIKSKVSTQLLVFLGVGFFSYLFSGCTEKNGDQPQSKKKEKTAITFIQNDDCLNCHNIEDKSVGPSYVQVAQKYEADFRTVNRLADKIIEGGGMWGSEQMSKHPFLEKADARRIVRWILSLSDTTINISPLRHTPGFRFPKFFKKTKRRKNMG